MVAACYSGHNPACVSMPRKHFVFALASLVYCNFVCHYEKLPLRCPCCFPTAEKAEEIFVTDDIYLCDYFCLNGLLLHVSMHSSVYIMLVQLSQTKKNFFHISHLIVPENGTVTHERLS